MGTFIRLQRNPNLPEVVRTLAAATRFAGRLDRRQQQADEQPNDCNHDQQFNEGKTV